MNLAEAIQEIKIGKIVYCNHWERFFRRREDKIVTSGDGDLPIDEWLEVNLRSCLFNPDRIFEIYESTPAPLDGKTAEIDGRKYKLTAVE